MPGMQKYRPAQVGEMFQSPCRRWLFQVIDIFDDGAYAGFIIPAAKPQFPDGWWEHTPEELHFLGFTLMTPPTNSVH